MLAPGVCALGGWRVQCAQSRGGFLGGKRASWKGTHTSRCSRRVLFRKQDVLEGGDLETALLRAVCIHEPPRKPRGTRGAHYSSWELVALEHDFLHLNKDLQGKKGIFGQMTLPNGGLNTFYSVKLSSQTINVPVATVKSH